MQLIHAHQSLSLLPAVANPKLAALACTGNPKACCLGLHWQSQSLQPWPAVANPTLPAVAKSSKNSQKRQLSPKNFSVQIEHFY